MHSIVLRKWRGSGSLEAFFRPINTPSFGSGPAPSSVFGVLFSLPVIILLVLAFAIALLFATGSLNPAFADTLVPAADSVKTDSLQLLADGVGATASFGKLREMRQARSKAIADARAVVDLAEREKRDLTGDEDTKYKAFFAEGERLKNAIDREERLIDAEREVAATVEEQRTDPAKETPDDEKNRPAWRSKRGQHGTGEYRSAFGRFLSVGLRGMKPDEHRALSVGSDTAGGFTTASEQFVEGLIKAVDNVLWIRQLATKIPVPTAQSLGAVSLDADPEDADWTSEIAEVDEDSDMAFGKRKLTPHPLAKLLKVSNDFLRMNLVGGEALVRDRLAYKNAVPQEKGFMTGTGFGQALGAFTASNDGVPTSRDVSTGNLSTSPTFDGLMGAKYSLKSAYWTRPSTRWVFHRDVMLAIAKLKDGNGQYLWRESVRAGEPDMLLSVGIAMSEYAPSTLTTGLYVGAIADWSHYWIADAYDVVIKRLDELYARTNQTGFISRSAVDGMPVLAEAFARVKLA